MCVRGGGESGGVSASSYLKKKKSHSLYLPPLLLQKSADHFLWLLAASSPAFLGLVFRYLFFYSHYRSLLYGGDDTSPARLPQLPHPSDPAATSLLPRSTRPL